MSNERIRGELNEVFDRIAGTPSWNLSQRVRSSLVHAPKTRDHIWIAAVAAVMITALLVGVLVATRPHTRSVPSSPHVASPARTDSCGADISVPSPRAGAGLAFDAKHGYVLMFGGFGQACSPGWVRPPGWSGNVTNETWKWDGTRWTLLHPTKAPSARTVTTMAYDPNTQRVILVNGGLPNADLPQHDMWAWDGTTWTELHPATIPPWCGEPAVTDRDLSVVLMIACNPTKQPDASHIWQWNGSDWSYVATGGITPFSRFDPGFAYDPDGHHVVLQGGWRSYGDSVKDTWFLTRGTWTQVPPASTSPAGSASAVYDESRHRLVLVTSDPSGLTTTWTWDGTSWTLHTPVHRTPGGAMVYDPINHQVITFGGKRNPSLDSTLLNETWAWNGEDWIQLSPRVSAATPPAAAASPTPSSSATPFAGCSFTPLPGLCVGRPATPQEEAAMIAVGRPAFEADWGFKDYSVCTASDFRCFKLGEPSRTMVGTNAGTFYGYSTAGPGVGGGGAGCFVFLYRDSGGWHYVNGQCAQGTGYIPGPQDRVFVSGCANVRDAAGLKSNVIACLANGTYVDVDSAPVYLDGHIWWHLANRGWMAHDYLVAPKDTP